MSPDPRRLRDEISLREASLADAAREHDAGELGDDEFHAIDERERAALARARAELSASDVSPTPRVVRLRRRRWLVTALVAFAAAAGVLLWSSLAPRQPGASITGSITLDQSQKVAALLSQAEADVANGNVVAALSAYRQVLALQPRNVVALTQTGWLDFSAGSASKDATLVALGIKDLERAITLAPRNPAARLYYAIVAASTPGDQALAKSQFVLFLSLHPSKGQLAVAAPFLAKFHLATGSLARP